MSQGIPLKYLVGIAVESGGYGVAEASPTFVLPATEFSIEPVINQVENNAMFGSTYSANDLANVTRQANVTATVKLNEEQLPLFFRQQFTVSSGLVSGETTVYRHTLTFDHSNTGASYTMFRDDDDKGSEYVAGVKFNTINLTLEKGGYITVALEGVGQFPAEWSGTTSATYLREFTSNHGTWGYVAEGAGYTTYDGVLEAEFMHEFSLSDDAVNFELGNPDLAALFTTASKFTADITTRFTDRTATGQLKYDFENGVYKAHKLTITDTSRYVTGSVTNVNPSITFEYPSARVQDWNESTEATAIATQSATLLALDKAGVAKAPLEIVVVNATASYD